MKNKKRETHRAEKTKPGLGPGTEKDKGKRIKSE